MLAKRQSRQVIGPGTQHLNPCNCSAGDCPAEADDKHTQLPRRTRCVQAGIWHDGFSLHSFRRYGEESRPYLEWCLTWDQGSKLVLSRKKGGGITALRHTALDHSRVMLAQPADVITPQCGWRMAHPADFSSPHLRRLRYRKTDASASKSAGEADRRAVCPPARRPRQHAVRRECDRIHARRRSASRVGRSCPRAASSPRTRLSGMAGSTLQRARPGSRRAAPPPPAAASCHGPAG